MNINLNIQNDVIEALKNKLKNDEKIAIRLLVTSYGWAGPNLGIALDEPREDDISKNIEGLQFVIDKDEAYLFDNAKILFHKGIFGDKFKVLRAGASSKRC